MSSVIELAKRQQTQIKFWLLILIVAAGSTFFGWSMDRGSADYMFVGMIFGMVFTVLAQMNGSKPAEPVKKQEWKRDEQPRQDNRPKQDWQQRDQQRKPAES